MTSLEKPVEAGWPPDMWETGRYIDSKMCRICGVEVPDTFLERHVAFHKSLVTIWRDKRDDES